jgi:hypothetical protein
LIFLFKCPWNWAISLPCSQEGTCATCFNRHWELHGSSDHLPRSWRGL